MNEANSDTRIVPAPKPDYFIFREANPKQGTEHPLPMAHYYGNALIYIEIDHGIDFTVDAHWMEYLWMREATPKLVRIFSKTCELKEAAKAEGVLV
jgi:hypothetical protein